MVDESSVADFGILLLEGVLELCNKKTVRSNGTVFFLCVTQEPVGFSLPNQRDPLISIAPVTSANPTR